MKTVSLKSDGFIAYPMLRTQEELLTRTQLVATWIQKNLKGKRPLYICRGSSGLFAATALLVQSGMGHVVYVRKDGESNHNSAKVLTEQRFNSDPDNDVPIFVDDMIASGGTLRETIQKLKETYNYMCQLQIVCLLYDTSGWRNSPGDNIMKGLNLNQIKYYIHFE